MGLSRSEQSGALYVWGKDEHGQLGISNKANKIQDEMGDEKMKLYP